MHIKTPDYTLCSFSVILAGCFHTNTLLVLILTTHLSDFTYYCSYQDSQNLLLSLDNEKQCYFNQTVDGHLSEFEFNSSGDALTSFELHAENNQVLSGPSILYDKQVLPLTKVSTLGVVTL